MPITVFITDDHKILKETWAKILSDDPRFRVMGTFESGEATVEAVRHICPDIVLLDVKLPLMSGLEATRLIRKISPGSKVLGYSFYADVDSAAGMIEEGAMGFVTKNCDVEEVIIALISIYNNEHYICDEMKMYIAHLYPKD